MEYKGLDAAAWGHEIVLPKDKEADDEEQKEEQETK